MKEYKITEQLANAILQYLSKQPFMEVAELIKALQLIEIIETKEEKKK